MTQTRSMVRSEGNRRSYGHMITAAGRHVLRHGHRYLSLAHGAYKHTTRAINHHINSHNRRHAKKDEEHMHGDDVVGGITGTALKIPPWKHWPRTVLAGTKTHMHDVYSFNTIGDQQSGAGQQGFIVLSEVGTMFQFLGFADGTGTPGARNMSLAAYTANPDSGTANAGYFSAQTISATSKMLLAHCQLGVSLTNQTSVPLKATLLVLQAKQHIVKNASATAGLYTYQDSISIWGDCLKNESQGQSAQTMGGTTTPLTATRGYPSILMPNTLPTSTKTFHKFYRCLKAHTIHLGAGADEDISISIPMRQTINFAQLIAKAPNVGFNGTETQYPLALLAGGISVVLIWRGVAITDATQTTHVSNYGPTTISTVVDEKLTYHFLKSKSANTETQVAVDALQQPSGVTGFKVLNASTLSSNVPATAN